MPLGQENDTQASFICVKLGKAPLLTLRLENHIEGMDDAREVQYFCFGKFVIHRPYAAGSRQLSRALAAMEGFLGNEAYRGNFVNKNIDYHMV